MAKKTTSNRKTEPSIPEAPESASLAKPARKAVAKLANTVKKTITDALTPRQTKRKPKQLNPVDPSVPVAGQPPPKPRRGAPGATKPRSGSTRSSNGSSPNYTQEDVELRAYFLAERRRVSNIPGSPDQDWIEAERQLAAESQPALAVS